jgi:hypothetical protein
MLYESCGFKLLVAGDRRQSRNELDQILHLNDKYEKERGGCRAPPA